MSKLKYYFKLYVANMSRSMISRMEYKNDLIIGIFGFFIQNVAAVLSIYFIIKNIPSLSGWNMYQMGFLYGFTMMPIAIDHLLQMNCGELHISGSEMVIWTVTF